MQNEIVIAVSIVAAIAVMFGIKAWLGKLLKFKMDESAIVSFLENTDKGEEFVGNAVIAAGTNIEPSRVAAVCIKSKSLCQNANDEESWCLKK